MLAMCCTAIPAVAPASAAPAAKDPGACGKVTINGKGFKVRRGAAGPSCQYAREVAKATYPHRKKSWKGWNCSQGRGGAVWQCSHSESISAMSILYRV
jgi:hypothetical protein